MKLNMELYHMGKYSCDHNNVEIDDTLINSHMVTLNMEMDDKVK